MNWQTAKINKNGFKSLFYGVLLSACIWASIIAPSSVHAAQFETLGKWDVHYIVLNSTFLQPNIAQQYGIQRSKYNAFVNISVLDHNSQEAQDVVVQGVAKNLLGVQKTLEFEQVKEQQAIYYLAQLPFDHRETYQFTIKVFKGNEQQTLNFKQKLLID